MGVRIWWAVAILVLSGGGESRSDAVMNALGVPPPDLPFEMHACDFELFKSFSNPVLRAIFQPPTPKSVDFLVSEPQRKTQVQQLKGKIVSEFFTLFQTFSDFSPQDFPLQNKGL